MQQGKRKQEDDLPEVGPWARDKLRLLQSYLIAYSRVLHGSRSKTGWPDRILYIDAFAGAGVARVRNTGSFEAASLFRESSGEMRADRGLQQLLEGSPLIAKRVEPPFTALVFIERSRRRAAHLMTRLGDDTRVHVVSSECNDYLISKLLTQSPSWWSRTRALVFLDPFGMQVPWSTLVRLAKTEGIEVILNLPLGMAVQRLLPRDGRLTAAERSKLDAYFGDRSWTDRVYSTQPGLFDADVTIKLERAERDLADWYSARLRAAFGNATRGFPVRNTRGKTLYHLFWAGRHPKGLEIATSIFSPAPRAPRRKRTR